MHPVGYHLAQAHYARLRHRAQPAELISVRYQAGGRAFAAIARSLRRPGWCRPGGGLTRITNAGGAADIPIDYSPDGKQIVFFLFTQKAPGTGQEEIATANADGSEVQQVTNSPTFDLQPDWGPHPLTGKHKGRGGSFAVPLAAETRSCDHHISTAEQAGVC
jgi:hypothetical protein